MSATTRSSGPWLPRLVVAPSFLLSLLFIYGLMAWNGYLSFSASRILPNYDFVGLAQYEALFDNERFRVAMGNLAIFGVLFIGGAMAVGVVLAILLDQKVRGEGLLRTIYLYPMAISFIVTGTAWKWMLNPGQGLEHLMHQWGFENFSFDWLINPEMAIYCVVIAGVWQSAGFVMALFLAALRGPEVDAQLIADGGIRRGTDILKALALGARADSGVVREMPVEAYMDAGISRQLTFATPWMCWALYLARRVGPRFTCAL